MLPAFVVCDLETTGLSPGQNEIIEVGLVRVEHGRVKDTWHSLIRPRQRLPIGIRRLTGLDDGQLRDSPALAEVLPRILDFLRGYPLVGHNVSFDREFMEAAARKQLTNPTYDTLELARMILPFSPGYRLGDLCRYLGIENEKEHRALSDALATVELYNRLMAALKDLDGQLLLYLHAFLQRAGSSWAGPLAGFLGQAVQQAMAAKISGALFFTPPELDSFAAPGKAGPEKVFTGMEEVTALFAPGGLLATRLENYEHRPQQKEMVAAVCRALAEKKHLLLEAGTGTGKSMAYLVPAINQALSNGERVVVATYTINLQGQLWQKDIPVLTRALAWPGKVALIKGRQNYLCLRRWLNTLTAGNWSPEEAAFYARLLVWAAQTKTGDRAELNLNGREQEFWPLVCADSEGCLGAHCQWFRKVCYVTRARKAAEAAHLIVTNHSLLFSDLRSENRLLPAYGPLIIDEAHHLEEVATEQLGVQVTRAQFKRWLGAVGRLLTRLAGLTPPAISPSWPEILASAREDRQKTAQAAEIFFQAVSAQVINRSAPDAPETGPWTLRLRPGKEREPFLEAELANLTVAWEMLLDRLQKIVNHLEEWMSLENGWKNYYGEALGQLTAGRDLAAGLAFVFRREEEKYVYWIEVAREEEAPKINLCAAPVYVGGIINEQLFQPKETVILTSATLSVEGDFAHFMERVGLDLVPAERLLKVIVDSPFQYDQQSLLCVVKNIPLQGEVPEDEYFAALLPVLTGLIETAAGKTLVLFTSHRSLQETYRRLKSFCEETDIYLLGHNIDGSRLRLIEEFRANERAVLLGAASFWEGVDIPGDALSCVVIVKLPFGVPTVPIVAARLEDLARRGKDGFRHFSLPQAVIRFKQGFGRLIRTMRDRGVVVVLDHRLINRRYGKQFLNSLPLKSHLQVDGADLNRYVASWLQK